MEHLPNWLAKITRVSKKGRIVYYLANFYPPLIGVHGVVEQLDKLNKLHIYL